MALALGRGRYSARPRTNWSGADVTELLGRTDVRTIAPDEAVPEELLADLYDPRLVISAEYVGVDRRRPAREGGRTGSGRGSPSGLRRSLLVAVATAAAVVPLTLVAVQASQPTAAGPTTGAQANLTRAAAAGGQGPRAHRAATGHAAQHAAQHAAVRAAARGQRRTERSARQAARLAARDHRSEARATRRLARRAAASTARSHRMRRAAAPHR